MPDLIVFDLDGTLIDSLRDLAAAINATRAMFSLKPLSVETVTSCVGNGVKVLIQRAFKDAPEVGFDDALARYSRYYAEHLTVYTRLYPGVADGLKAMHDRGIKLAVVTNKPSSSAKVILTDLQVADCFDALCGGDGGVPLKPAPDMLLLFKERFNSKDCWMIGDHYTDLEAGRRAGFRRGFARYGFGDPHDEIPDFTLDSFPDLVSLALKD